MAGRLDRDVWNGTKPMFERVAPPDARDVPLYAVVWEQAPTGADHERRGGIVVARGADRDTGETWVEVLAARTARGRFEVFRRRLAVNDIDPTTVEAPTSSKMQRAARHICRALGERPAAYFSERDLNELHSALALVVDSQVLDGERR